jgi:nucleotide-binding universal stress UspA family protein
MHFKKLLVAVDGSEPSSAALDFALHRAKSYDAEVTIAYAFDRSAIAAQAWGPYGAIDSYPLVRAIREEADAVMASASDRAAREGVRATTLVLEGSPARVILERAQASSADAIVVGTHGRSGVSRLAFGSVAEAILRVSDVPVFVVREAAILASNLATILVACDGSEASAEAGRCALELARTEGAEIVYCTVVDPNVLRWSRAEYGYDPDHFVTAVAREAIQLLEHTLDEAESSGVKTRSLLRYGDASNELLESARDVAADMIVLGTHGRRGLGRVFLGSVAESVLRRSAVPVCTVRPQALAWQRLGGSRGERSVAS